ncbi:MAG: glycosyltransferase family 4 protein [Muribaculaceae bacterium]|nr:glycosyltransferase family 4 protein [Muribaculaceae bacterium]
MRIVVTGTRGIPDIQGGVETHCQELYPRISALGHEVTVIRRSCYLTPKMKAEARKVRKGGGRMLYKGVRLLDIFAPRRKSIEAALHTFLAVWRARAMKPDVLHIHAIGPSLMVPLACLLGMKVVTTNHGPDYDRGKWGKLAKKVLMTGEKWGAKRSNEVIVISQVIADILAEKYGRKDTHLIYNGVPAPTRVERTDYIESLGLAKDKYVLALGRFVPEKNFDMLIKAWSESDLPARGIKLCIAGDADHEDDYSRRLKQLAREKGVVLTGFIRGEKLAQVMSHACMFVLPSSHEGLPISLLEAMSYNINVAVSDIPANKIPQLEPADFFHLSMTDPEADTMALRQLLNDKIANPGPREYDLRPYDWDHIAQQTLQVYASLV